MMSSVSKTADQSPTALGSSASASPGTLGAHSSSSDRTGVEKSVAKAVNEHTAGLKCGIRMQTRSPAWEPVAETTNKTIGTKLYHYNFQISNVDHPHVRQSLSRPQGDEMLDIDVKAMIWRIFMSATMKTDGSTSWTRLSRKSPYNQEHRLRKSENIVRHFAESKTESESRKMGYLQEIGIQFHGWEPLCYTTEKSSYRKQKNTITLSLYFVMAKFMNILIQRNPAVASWVYKSMEENRIQLEKFEDQIISMSMYHDIDWREAGNQETCISKSLEVAANAKRLPTRHRSFLGSRTERKWCGTHTCNPDG